jgi:hypothetical protein
MAKIGGTQVNIGIGIESTPGTAVAASAFPKWTDLNFQAVSEKANFTSQRGVRNHSSNSMIRRRYSQGAIGLVPNVSIAPYLFYLTLGSLASATASGESAVYEHTCTVQNANASMKTATVLLEQGGEVTERFANCVVNQLSLDVSDSYAKVTVDLLGGFPDTGSVTESYAQETEFAYHQMFVKFGTSLSNAASQTATPLKALTLSINNNVLVDEAFLSGANTPAAWLAGRLEITGSYTLHFSGTTELDKYKANTKNAALISFQGASIGSAETEEILLKLGRIILSSPPKEYNLDGLVVLKQSFTVEYDATDKEIQAIITNTTASY